MAPRKSKKTLVLLTQRALRDFADIEAYSIEQFGKRTANRYLSDLEAGLERIRDNPQLLRSEKGFHASLRFYSVNKHVFVCDVLSYAIFVLTVLHGSTDIPGRLHELAPTLSMEAELLHRKFQQSQTR
jgi:plasmid stabilization system protein ParE